MLTGDCQPYAGVVDCGGLQWLLITETGVSTSLESSRRFGIKRTDRTSEGLRAELFRNGDTVAAAAAFSSPNARSAQAVLKYALEKIQCNKSALHSPPLSFDEPSIVERWDESTSVEEEDQLRELLASIPKGLSAAISYHRVKKHVSFYRADSVVSELRELWGVAIDFWGATTKSEGLIFREAGGVGAPQLTAFVERTLSECEQIAGALLSPRSSPAKFDSFVLSAKAANMLFHEVIGHTLEQNHLTSALANVRGGDLILPPFVNVTDDPTCLMFGYRRFDDFGIPTHRSDLIDAGRIYGCFGEQSFAEQRGLMAVDAHWRQDLRRPARRRMSNLIVGPGVGTIDEFINSTSHGCYIERASEGIVDPKTGTFTILVTEAYLIVRGRRRERLNPFTLVGQIGDLKMGLIALSSDTTETAMYCSTGGSTCPTGLESPGCILHGMRTELNNESIR